MRIGMLADIYKPHISGVTRYIEENQHALQDLGHEVTVFTFGGTDTPPELGIVRSPGLPIAHAGFYFNLRYSAKAKFRLQQMDVVHTHHPFISGRLALGYCRPLNIPVVFTNHTRYDLYIKSYLPALPEVIGDTFLRTFLPSFCGSVDAVISPSQGMKKILEDIGVKAPIQVIPNGVDLSRFSGRVVPCNRFDYGLDKNDFVFIFAGRLAYEKNLYFLLIAFATLVEDHPAAKLLMVGIGPQKAELERAVKEMGLDPKVKFTGLVPYSEMPGLLSMSDAFVTASVSEVHPLSVIEAMACGLPVVAITSPGISDTVTDEVTGFLSNQDEGTFVLKMTRLMSDEAMRRRMAKSAQAAVRCYDLAITARRVENLYQELVEKSKARQHGVKFNLRRVIERWHT